jgi:hypothetical protein
LGVPRPSMLILKPRGSEHGLINYNYNSDDGTYFLRNV